MAITVVQVAKANNGPSGGSVAVTLGTAVTGGNTLIVIAATDNGNLHFSSVTDNQLNSYTFDGKKSYAQEKQDVEFWHVSNCKPGSTTVTATLSGAGVNRNPTIFVLEVNGLLGRFVGVVGQYNAVGPGTPSALYIGAGPVLAVNFCYCFAGGSDQVSQEPSDYTELYNQTVFANNDYAFYLGYKVVTAASTENPLCTITGSSGHSSTDTIAAYAGNLDYGVIPLPETTFGPPIRGAPWLPNHPRIADGLVLGTRGSTPGPRTFAAETTSGPPIQGAPWFTRPTLERQPWSNNPPIIPPPPVGPHIQEQFVGPPLQGAPWFHPFIEADTGFPPYVAPPSPPQKYAPEINAGPPLRGAPWVQQLPVEFVLSPQVGNKPLPTPPKIQSYAPELHAGPPLPGAPWFSVPSIPGTRISPPAPTPPKPPVPILPGAGTAKPFVPHDPSLEPRLRRFVDITAQILNSLMAQGILVQTGQQSWSLTLGAGSVISLDGRAGAVTLILADVLSTLSGPGFLTSAGLRLLNAGDLPFSGVVAGGYTTPNLIIDQYGRILSATSTSAAGVTSWNTRTGAVTLTSVDVTTALGFTPGTGTVTSVGLALPAQFTVTNSPVTTSGTLTATLTASMILADGSQAFTAAQSMGGFRLTNLADATARTDAVTLQQLQNNQPFKQECQGATNTTLAAYTYNNGASGVGATITMTVAAVLVLDGYTPVLNDRLLVKNETGGNAPYNGIYTLTTVGTVVIKAVLTRATDFDEATDGISGAIVFVQNGTVNGRTSWYCSTFGSITIGTTNINWSQYAGPGQVAGGDLTGTYPNPAIAAGVVTEAKQVLADNTTANVTSSAHGYAPKSPADATQFLNGAATPAYAQVTDANLSTSDITTNNVSTTKHGFAPKAPNDNNKFLDGTAAFQSLPNSINGTATLGSVFNISAANGTFQDTGLSVSLPSAGVYLLYASVRADIQFSTGSSAVIYAKLYNSTDAADIGHVRLCHFTAVANSYAADTAGWSEIFTASGAKTVKLYAARDQATGWSTSAIGSDTNGFTSIGYVKLSN